MCTAGMKHPIHSWVFTEVMCNAWSNTYVCVCTCMLFYLERWHSFVNLALKFLFCLVSQVEIDEWHIYWVDNTHTVRKEWYTTVSVRSTWRGGHCVHSSVLASGLCCKWQEAQSVREGLHWGSIVSAFTSTTSGPCCLENIFFLWWGQEEISGCHWKHTKTQSYTQNSYFTD